MNPNQPNNPNLFQNNPAPQQTSNQSTANKPSFNLFGNSATSGQNQNQPLFANLQQQGNKINLFPSLDPKNTKETTGESSGKIGIFGGLNQQLSTNVSQGNILGAQSKPAQNIPSQPITQQQNTQPTANQNNQQGPLFGQAKTSNQPGTSGPLFNQGRSTSEPSTQQGGLFNNQPKINN